MAYAPRPAPLLLLWISELTLRLLERRRPPRAQPGAAPYFGRMADLMSDDRMEAEYGQSSVRALPPEQAAALAQQGATLLLLGVPQGTQIAINFHTFTAVRSLGDGHTKPALSPSPIAPPRLSLPPQRSPVQPRPRLTRVSGAGSPHV